MTVHSWQLFLFTFAVLWVSSYFGATVLRRLRSGEPAAGEELRLILGATLTLLGLIIGFTLSMAIGGYNARAANEAAEAAALGTAYVRADLLPRDDAAKMRPLLARYLDERLRFYTAHEADALREVAEETASLKQALWQLATDAAARQPTPVTSLAVAGINDVLTSSANTSAGWRSQIPLAAWGLVAAIAICCNVLMGYNIGERRNRSFLVILPLVIAVSLAMIGDIDIPGRGLIHVSPVNLERAAASLTGTAGAH